MKAGSKDRLPRPQGPAEGGERLRFILKTERKIQVKRFLAIILSVMLMLGCMLDVSLADETIELTFWNGFTGADGALLAEIVQRFNDCNGKGIHITMDIMPWATLHEKLPGCIATGTAPDFVLLGSDNYAAYAQNGMLKTLESFWDMKGVDKSNFAERVLNLFVLDGQTYGIPMQIYCNYLYWNKDIFAAAGLDPEAAPKTYDELIALAQQLTDAEKNIYGFGLPVDYEQSYHYMFMSNGGDYINEDATASVFQSESNLAVLRDISRLTWETKSSPVGYTQSELENLMCTGNLAMLVNGNWMVGSLNANEINWGVTIFPEGSAGHRGDMGGNMFAVPVSTDDARMSAIYDFIAYWDTTAICKEWTMANGNPPFLYSVINDEEVKANNTISVMAQAVEYNEPVLVGIAAQSEIFDDALLPCIEKVMNGADPAEALAEADALITGFLQE